MLVRGNCSICFDVTARATLQVGYRPFWYQALVFFKEDQTRDGYPAGLYLFPPFITGQLGKASKKFSRVLKLSYLLDSKEIQGFSASAPRRAIRDVGFAGNSLNPTIGGCQRVHGIKLTDHIPHGWAGTQPFYGAESGGIIIHPPD